MLKTEHQEIRYLKIWGRLYIILSLIFCCIFILGSAVLEDYTILLNLILCAFMLMIGRAMLNKPYAIYNQTEIIQYSYTGKVRKHYVIAKGDQLELRKNRFYLNNRRLRMNHWFVNKSDWERMVKYFGGASNLEDELID